MEEQTPIHSNNLDIDQLKYLAHKRFIEGIPTLELLQQAKSAQEKEQVALVALLHVTEDLTVEFHCQGDGTHNRQLRDVQQTMQQMGIIPGPGF